MGTKHLELLQRENKIPIETSNHLFHAIQEKLKDYFENKSERDKEKLTEIGLGVEEFKDYLEFWDRDFRLLYKVLLLILSNTSKKYEKFKGDPFISFKEKLNSF